jgi:hypothetical protein
MFAVRIPPIPVKRLKEPAIWFLIGGFTGLAIWLIKHSKEDKDDSEATGWDPSHR